MEPKHIMGTNFLKILSKKLKMYMLYPSNSISINPPKDINPPKGLVGESPRAILFITVTESTQPKCQMIEA